MFESMVSAICLNTGSTVSIATRQFVSNARNPLILIRDVVQWDPGWHSVSDAPITFFKNRCQMLQINASLDAKMSIPITETEDKNHAFRIITVPMDISNYHADSSPSAFIIMARLNEIRYQCWLEQWYQILIVQPALECIAIIIANHCAATIIVVHISRYRIGLFQNPRSLP